MENIHEIKYAGFFTRLLATLVDLIVVSFLLYILHFVIDHESVFLIFFIWGAYSSLTISRWKATIGGKLFGIEIVDTDLKLLPFKRTSVRFIVSVIPFLLYIYFRGIQYDTIPVPSPTIQQLPQLLFFLPPFIMFFTKKSQMLHDLIIRSVVVDVSEQRHIDNDREENKLLYFGQKTLRAGGTLFFLVIFAYSLVYVWVFYSLGKSKHTAYNASFHTKYNVDDYNDTKIIFYNKELERNSKKFIDAEGMYDIFEADVKRDLALNCIRYFLAKEHNETNWIDKGSAFRKNARNKYAETEEKIKQAKKNEDYMGKYFYDYDLNEVNHIEDEVADVWRKDANQKTCQVMLPVDQMYEMFIMKYIHNREEALVRDEQAYQIAKPIGTLNKSFYKKRIEIASAWLDTLYEKFPEHLQKRREKEAALEKEYQRVLKKEKEEKEEKTRRKKEQYQKELKNGKSPLFVAIKYNMNDELDEYLIQNINLESRDSNGFTPLFMGISQKNIYAVKRLLEYGANMYTMDLHNIYSAFTWAVSSNNIEIVQLFLDNGVDVNYQYNKSETALTIAAKGCKNFEMVTLLLNHDANPELLDTFGQSTISGLSRYCKHDEDFKKMKNILEKSTSF